MAIPRCCLWELRVIVIVLHLGGNLLGHPLDGLDSWEACFRHERLLVELGNSPFPVFSCELEDLIDDVATEFHRLSQRSLVILAGKHHLLCHFVLVEDSDH